MNHRFRDTTTPFRDQGYKIDKVIIGENCWIGSNVIILKGAEIGNNCVIGANCTIDFNVPNNTLIQVDNTHLQKTQIISKE